MRCLAFIACLVLLVFAPGCGRESTFEKEIAQGILKIGNGAEPETLDPHLSTSTSALNVQMALFEGLVSPDPENLKPLPGLAERWDVLEDGHRIRFYLRKSLLWSDGAPITASGIVKSWERFLSPELAAPYAANYYAIRGAEAFNKGEGVSFEEVGIFSPAEGVVEFELAAPISYFVQLLLHPSAYPVPVHLFPNGKLKDRSFQWIEAGESFVGSGPFKLSSRDLSQRMQTVKNEFYWDANSVSLNQIEFWTFDDASVEERAFLAGQIHVTDTLPPARIGSYREAEDPRLRIDPYLGVYYLLLNHEHPLLADSRVREALSLAINRKAIVENLLGAGQTVANTFVPPTMPDYDGVDGGSGYNPKKAEEIWKSLSPSLSTGIELEYLFNTSENHRRIAEAIQAMWKETLGVDIQLVNQEWRVYLDRRSNQDFQIARAVWIGDYLEPSTFLNLWGSDSTNNWISWSDAEYDRLMAMAKAELDDQKRNEYYSAAERRLLEDFAVIPLYHYTTAYLKRPELKGWEVNLLDWHPYKYLRFEKAATP